MRSGLTSRQTGPRRSRDGYQPDPEEHVHGAGSRVALRVIRSEEQVEHDEQPGGEPQGAQGGTGGPGVGEALDGGRDRTACRSPQNREADQSRPSARKETKSAVKASAKA
ncbi:hypothetical protein SCALM49S_05305 [Streptomyces californicus]